MNPAPPVMRIFTRLWSRGRQGSRRRRQGALGVVVFLLDAGLLAVLDEPAQERRFVHAHDEPLRGVEDGRIVDELAGGTVALVELPSDRIEVPREAPEVLGELLAEVRVVQQDRQRPLALL